MTTTEKNIKTLKNVKVIDAANSNNSFINVINSNIVSNSKMRFETESYYSIPDSECLAIKIGPNCLGPILGNKMMTEEEFICRLYNILIIQNI